MADDDPIVLYQHPPGWGLASRDAACLAVQTALKLARLPFTVNNAGNTAVSPTGELPLLCAGEELFSGFGPCLAYIRNRDTSDVFNALTDEEGASAKAFMSLVQVELQYAKIYWYWFEEDNYTAVTHPRFASRFAWPLNIFLAWRQQRDYHALLSTKFEQVSAEKIYAAASTALDALSARLGDSDWFFAR
ncbi:hypothetical protein, variant [Capsaspora owczarzaki ATCC 30864]|uniref:Mitochondrial outer membrane transport complex Sam37/metaxin N-terminal domain-containing protein n=1 Tax=Capsaspora owczarzaki (strain ATCC 30864) TaxID=595528 RepID=A0A0D2VN12_CAPO3|nr:hypothetical protein, variant [Capsaspora owczarzaki ATCC 30864]